MLRTQNSLSANTIAETTQQRTARDPNLNGSSLCYHFTCPLMPNKNEFPEGFNKPKYESLILPQCYGHYLVYTGCSSICLATIWCTLHIGTPNLLSAKTIVETTERRTAIDPKRIISLLPLYMSADAK